jgi:hypothetical protein
MRIACSALVWLSGLAVGCGGGLTREDAREALDEIQISSQAQALTSSAVEIGTSFSIGEGAQRAAEGLRDFVVAELPCAEVALGSGQVSVEYGARGDDCTYNGQHYRGEHVINVSSNDAGQVVVDHVWTNLENERVRVSGTATVTWSLEDQTRRVVHDLEWTRLRDGRGGQGSGDRLQHALAGGWSEGFGVDGERRWQGQAGSWQLTMDGVEMRWQDPVPQAGRYTLETPFDERVSATFVRTSSSQIRVTISGERRSFDFEVDDRSE